MATRKSHASVTIFIQLSASMMRQIYHARGKGSCQDRLIPMNTICDELRERECYVVNEYVLGCICGHSKYDSGDIASTHDYGDG